MNIKSDTSQISILRNKVEDYIDFPLSTHGDFQRLSVGIEYSLREHISESTLERVWKYSTRKYDTISVRTLNVLCRFIGYKSWEHFTTSLSDSSSESELFSGNIINTSDLSVGARIKIEWPPDRVCIIRYLGQNRFIAEETKNSTMKPNDTFLCTQFYKGRELHLNEFCRNNTGEKFCYIIGKKTGIIRLEIL